MNRALVTFLAAAGLATACSNVGPTETVRNDIEFDVESESDPEAPIETITLNISDLSILLRGEEGQEYAMTAEEGKNTFGDASGSLANVLGGALAPKAEASVSIECGIYDVSVTAAESPDPCVFEANADYPFGVYLCFVDGVWPLSNTINPDNCPGLFVHSTDR